MDAMDSRFRGNDVTDAIAVIPAKAGIHRAFVEDGCVWHSAVAP